jgi:transcriptional regulator with XRE-family HTH domain
MTPNRRLKQARELRGWSQAKIAELIGTDATTVSRWERGLFFPTPYFREKLCVLFGKNAEELGLLETESPAMTDEPVNRVNTEKLTDHIDPLIPPSWSKRTDTFTYILHSAAYDQQAHLLWENAYVRALLGQRAEAKRLGEASLSAFERIGHLNAIAIREWLSQPEFISPPPLPANIPLPTTVP